MKKETDPLPMGEYDKIIVAFSGGKDSTACVLDLLERDDVDRDKIELWHHDVDGWGETFMDWPCTVSYCRAFAKAFDLPLLFSFRRDGFLAEMLRDDSASQPIMFQVPGDTTFHKARSRPRPGTRKKFPQVSADLKVRWCSAYLKIDVGRRIFANDPRFKEGKFLLVTGERAQESAARSKYLACEVYASSTKKRTVHQYRPVLRWMEERVWEIIEEHRVNPHPCYHLGWSRCSCMTCIFGDANQWASVFQIDQERVETIYGHELDFGKTINRKLSVIDQVKKGTPYKMDPRMVQVALSFSYEEDIIIPSSEKWELPLGAFKESGGPT